MALRVRLFVVLIICLFSVVGYSQNELLIQKLAIESRLPICLNRDRAIMVFERKDISDDISIDMSFSEQNTGNVPALPVAIKLAGPAKRYEYEIDISSWPDGEYKVFIKEKGTADSSVIVRGLFKQTLKKPQPPRGVIDMEGIIMFFVDDWYIEKSSGIKRQVHPADLIPVNPWETNKDYYYFRNSMRQYWFDINGDLNVHLSALNKLGDKPVQYWAKSSDMKTWQIIDSPLDKHQDCDIKDIINEVNRASVPDDKSVYRYYDEVRDGKVDLTQVSVLWTGTKKDVKWGDLPMPYRSRIAVWEKPDGQKIILAIITKDKSEFEDDEIGRWMDSNDNFGGLHFSSDGKTLRCYQSRLIPRHDPFSVHYDNLRCARVMITWSTTDGLHWTPTFFDAPTLEDPWSTQHYGLNLWTEENKRLEMAYHKIYDVQYQKVYTELAYSRDGVYWNRFDDGKAFLDNGAPGEWNFGYSMIIGHDRKKMSYDGYCYEPMTGINVLHFMFMAANYRDRSLVTMELFENRFDGRFMGEKGFQCSPIMNWYGSVENVINESKKMVFTPGFMKYRKDGWVSAEPKKRRAVLITKRFRSSGGLTINAKTPPEGFVMVEVLDEAGNHLKQYSGVNAAVFVGDDIDKKLNWSDGKVIKLPSVPFKLKMTLEKAEMYTLRFCGI